MGDAENNMLVPFSLNYIYDNPTRAFRADTKKCNESYEVRILYEILEIHIKSNLFFRTRWHVHVWTVIRRAL